MVALVFLIYTIACWMTCRFLYHDSPMKENSREQPDNPVPMSIPAERFKTERFIKENEQLKDENAQLKTKLDRLTAFCEGLQEKNGQLTEWQKTTKIYIATLSEALQAVKEANNRQAVDLEDENRQQPCMKADDDAVYDSGTTTDEFGAVVQVMKGRPITGEAQQQAVQAIRKTEGTDIYNQLVGRIAGAKQQIEMALNAWEQPESVNGDGYENFDIMKYIRV
jgi:hypothetical protein